MVKYSYIETGSREAESCKSGEDREENRIRVCVWTWVSVTGTDASFFSFYPSARCASEWQWPGKAGKEMWCGLDLAVLPQLPLWLSINVNMIHGSALGPTFFSNSVEPCFRTNWNDWSLRVLPTILFVFGLLSNGMKSQMFHFATLNSLYNHFEYHNYLTYLNHLKR